MIRFDLESVIGTDLDHFHPEEEIEAAVEAVSDATVAVLVAAEDAVVVEAAVVVERKKKKLLRYDVIILQSMTDSIYFRNNSTKKWTNT